MVAGAAAGLQTTGTRRPGGALCFFGLGTRFYRGRTFAPGSERNIARLEEAHVDATSITADVNFKVLRVLNERCCADFDVAGFRHHGHDGRIETRLSAEPDPLARLPRAEAIRIAEAEDQEGLVALVLRRGPS